MYQKRSRSVLCIGNDLVSLNLRCSLLRRHGWAVHSSGSGHAGVFRFAREMVDAVVIDLDDDGTEAALIAGELKRQKPEVIVIILVAEGKSLADGATQQADAVVLKSKEAISLVAALTVLLPPY